MTLTFFYEFAWAYIYQLEAGKVFQRGQEFICFQFVLNSISGTFFRTRMIEENKSTSWAKLRWCKFNKFLIDSILAEISLVSPFCFLVPIRIVCFPGTYFNAIGRIAYNCVKYWPLNEGRRQNVLLEDLRLAKAAVMPEICENIKLTICLNWTRLCTLHNLIGELRIIWFTSNARSKNHSIIYVASKCHSLVMRSRDQSTCRANKRIVYEI